MKTLEEEGLDSEGAVTSKSKLRHKVKALSGVDILTDTGAYKSTYQILLEISEVWNDINNDLDKAALLELISGGVTFARTHLIAGTSLEICTTI